MQFQVKVNIGKNEFTLGGTFETQKEFFEQAAFFTNLPQVGPNGEDDLQLMFRTTKEGYTYYSIRSEKAGKEYTFGQSQQKIGELFGKGWQDIYKAENAQSTNVAAQPGVGLGAPAAATPTPTPAPAAQAAPAPQPAAQPAPAPAAAPAQAASPQANAVLDQFLNRG